MADTVALMQQLGFGGYEARAYIALLQRSPLNGYELAKASGVPRSNIYPVLQKLEARGAVVRLEMPGGARYTPVPPQELLAQLGDQFQIAVAVPLQAHQLAQPVAPVRLGKLVVVVLQGGHHRRDAPRWQPQQGQQRCRLLAALALVVQQPLGEHRPLLAARFAHEVSRRTERDKRAALGECAH